ncbi:MAG: CBM9 family sugar-binding protein [Planctomycetes bacterium]|nr:CBM9 family sugar-binding protein [Planctomycetota bacterium]
MWNKLIYLISFVLVLSLVGRAPAQEPDILIRSPDLAMPVIDGVVDDVWSIATEQDILNTTAGSDPSGPADCSGKWRVLWDWEYIYALVVVRDEVLNNDSGTDSKWNDDSVEFYVDGDNSKGSTCDENDHQYTCRWNNTELETPSAYHNGEPSLVGFEYAIVTTGNGYIYEVRIPWTSIMGAGPTAGQEIGIEVFINDDDDGGDGDTQIGWYGTEENGWQTPSMWATAQLVAGNRAGGPKPANGSIYPDTWANISWMPGPTAISHDVYFGDNFEDVNAGAESTFQDNLTTTFMVVGFPGFAIPDGLDPGATYYWRIDAINAEGTIYEGVVWNFSVPPKTAYLPTPADGGDSVDPDVELSWTPGFGAKLHTVYFGENFEDISNAAGGLPLGVTDYTPGTLKFAKTYYWRVDEFDIAETHKGDVWSFTTEGAVGGPDPANGAVDVSQTPILTWVHGVNADTHQVYFGADAASLELKGSGNFGSENFEPGLLEWNTTYYWRVDEANNANTDSPWTGPLWSFTTANFLIIDDMESYNDLNEDEPGSNRIYLVWVDGYDNPAINGSVVGNDPPPFAEQTIVHGGLQSMPMAYNNAVGKSEATLTLTSNRDWTVNGVNTMTIWFRGDSGNTAETLYVILNGNARVDNDNPDAAAITSWTAWNIDLTRFADQGVNLANVNSITLGLSSVAGGAGMVYFDDIRLYPPAP